LPHKIMFFQTTCPSCRTTYSIEWHDFNHSTYDVENDLEDDEYEENEPTICPFCMERIDGHDEDEDYEL